MNTPTACCIFLSLSLQSVSSESLKRFCLVGEAQNRGWTIVCYKYPQRQQYFY